MTISRRQVLFGIGGAGLLGGLGLQLTAQSSTPSKGSDWQFVAVADTGMGDRYLTKFTQRLTSKKKAITKYAKALRSPF